MTPVPPAADAAPEAYWPETPVGRWMRPVVRFLRIEAASGLVLLGFAVAALLLANSVAASAFHALWDTPITLAIGALRIEHSLHEWVNDGLMTVFFFVVGLEIKREFAVGELRDPKKAALPLAAALGGMIVPAVIYLAFQFGTPGEAGWGIPVATDIAFAIGCLAILGPRVPHGLKIFLLSLAIADDIGAVLVIAVGYSHTINPLALGAGVAGFGLCMLYNRIGIRSVTVYVLVGAGVWLAFMHSGVHASVAGVILGLLTPARPWIGDPGFLRLLNQVVALLRGDRIHPTVNQRHELLMTVALTARETVPPLERLETTLHPWVAFGIMPLFAFANAGVHVNPTALGDPVAIAVACGLVFGKPVGVFLASWISVRLGVARLPTGVDWKVILGAGCLAGIGFTMALFIADLALAGGLLEAGKLGIFAGSAISGFLGWLFLYRSLPRRSTTEETSEWSPIEGAETPR